MVYPDSRFQRYILKNYIYIFYLLSFIVPFSIFLRTMNPGTFGWDTTWFHIQVPLLYVGQTTGFPIAFLIGKLFSFLPIGTMAFRLNMFSVFWGAMTLFVLFILLKNLLKNEYFIAFISVVFIGFFKVFWSQTNRFEVYTLNTVMLSTIFLAGFYWENSKDNKFLYLYYFLIGLSFTNHPIALFLSPAFILFPFYTNWKLVCRVKKIVIMIFLLILPNLLYLYIPIRSMQGFGNIDTLRKFIDYISGGKWKSSFGFKTLGHFTEQIRGYLIFLKGDFNILIVIIVLIGLVYLFIRKKKYFILNISLIILNFIPIILYSQINDFYLTSMIIFFALPFAAGLFWIKEGIVWFFNRFLRKPLSKRIRFLVTDDKGTGDAGTAYNETGKVDGTGPETFPKAYDNIKPCDEYAKKEVAKNCQETAHTHRRYAASGGSAASLYKRPPKNLVIVRAVFLLVFFAAISIFPANLFALNFNSMDSSKYTYAYDYWLDVLTKVKNDSIIISNSLTAHIPIYIDLFETKKNIQIVRDVNLDDIKRIVKENIGKRDIYYTDSYLPDLTQYYNVSQFGERFLMKDFKENFLVYKINLISVDAEITIASENLEMNFGKKTRISFLIKNNSSVALNMNSIELKLPKIIKFLEISPDSDMKSAPGLAKGSYMWTAGPYKVEPGAVYNLSFDCQAIATGSEEIRFRITAGNMYIEGPKIKVSAK